MNLKIPFVLVMIVVAVAAGLIGVNSQAAAFLATWGALGAIAASGIICTTIAIAQSHRMHAIKTGKKTLKVGKGREVRFGRLRTYEDVQDKTRKGWPKVPTLHELRDEFHIDVRPEYLENRCCLDVTVDKEHIYLIIKERPDSLERVIKILLDEGIEKIFDEIMLIIHGDDLTEPWNSEGQDVLDGIREGVRPGVHALLSRNREGERDEE